MPTGPTLEPAQLLKSLLDAGWDWLVDVERFHNESFDYVEGDAWGAVLGRGLMQLEAEFSDDQLVLGPLSVPIDEDGFDFLDSEIYVDVDPDDAEGAAAAVFESAADAGLLDVTNVGASPDSGVESIAVWTKFMKELLFLPAASARGVPLPQLARELGDTEFEAYLSFLAFSGRLPAPEAVPPAAALGIVLCGWRNTSVEDAHVAEDALSDPVMAKLSICATRVARRLCTTERIDWVGIESELLAGDRVLHDGRQVADLFGSSWAATCESVHESFGKLQEIDTVIGPKAMVGYMSMLGSTSSTSNWWGNSQWPRYCRDVMRAREEASVVPPAPYDRSSFAHLLADLTDAPDNLSDQVLRFCINGIKVGGTWLPGLRDTVQRPPVVTQLDLISDPRAD